MHGVCRAGGSRNETPIPKIDQMKPRCFLHVFAVADQLHEEIATQFSFVPGDEDGEDSAKEASQSSIRSLNNSETRQRWAGAEQCASEGAE